MSTLSVGGLHVGSVESCSPQEIKVLLDLSAPQDVAFNTGRPQGFPRLNGYVLIPNERGTVVAVISRMTMEPGPPGNDAARLHFSPSRRRLFVTPLGTLLADRVGGEQTYKLKRGVASYPAVGDSVTLATAEQLRAVVEASGTDKRVRIGVSKLALDAPVTVDPDKLFGRHLGVFGNTGSGKSCTVAGLIRWSVQTSAPLGTSSARFIVLDPNGEYRTCFNDLRDKIDVKVMSVEPSAGEEQVKLPAWMWNGEEWAGAVEASPGTQRPVLMQAIRHLRSAFGEAGAAAEEPDQVSALFATKMRAFVTYLEGLRAMGVGVLSRFPGFLEHHRNLESLEAQLQGFSETLDADAVAVSELVDRTLAASTASRERRDDGRFKAGFVDGDIEEVVTPLRELLAALPDPLVPLGPSEDIPSPFDVTQLPEMISMLAGLQPGNIQQHMAGLELRLKTLLADPRIAPLIAPDGPAPGFKEWLEGLFGTGANQRGQITVVDLSLVPSDVRTTLVSVLGRLVFETAQRFRRQHNAIMPVVLVLEEAHNFLQRQGPDSNDTASAVRCRHMFEKIAKEGRKFGVGLVVSSQRPAELSATTVAQCNSFVLHRIVNDRDQELVSRLAPDTSGTLLKELPSLPTQQAILMGLASEIPLVFDVRNLPEEHRPSSENPPFWNSWTGAIPPASDLTDTVEAWLN